MLFPIEALLRKIRECRLDQKVISPYFRIRLVSLYSDRNMNGYLHLIVQWFVILRSFELTGAQAETCSGWVSIENIYLIMYNIIFKETNDNI